MSGWLETLARRVAGTKAPPEGRVDVAGDAEEKVSRDVLLRRATVAAATLLVAGAGTREASARSLSCGSEPGVRGSYKTYAGCVKNGAGPHFRQRIESCRREQAALVKLSEAIHGSWMSGGDPWLTRPAILSRELKCTQEAYGDWARAADECASRCPIPRPPRRKGPTQPVPTPTRPPGIPPGIPPSADDACLNCMGVGGQCCPVSTWPFFVCSNPNYPCSR